MAAHDAAVASSDAQRFAASHTLSHTLISSVVLTARPAITLACPGRPSEDGGYLHSALPGVLVLGRGHTKPQMDPDAIAPIAANAEARLLGSSLSDGPRVPEKGSELYARQRASMRPGAPALDAARTCASAAAQ